MSFKYDGKSRPSNKLYSDNFNAIFKKPINKKEKIFELKSKIQECRENGEFEKAMEYKKQLEEL